MHPSFIRIKEDEQMLADNRDEEEELELQFDLTMETYTQFRECYDSSAEELLRNQGALLQGIPLELRPNPAVYALRLAKRRS